MASKGSLRYAVVGLGYFAQAAVLPAFRQARGAQLQAIVSSDMEKLRTLGDKYDVPLRLGYDDYDALLASGDIDVVYIVLPNTMHEDYTVRAARAGIHVLCEKPMALDEESCTAMIDAARAGGVRLMIGYRLHFAPAHIAVIDAIEKGDIGEPRFFHATFAMQITEDNIRLREDLGGGPLYDIGIYCINAARYVFRSEPVGVTAMSMARADDRRFHTVDEAVTATLHFPEERIATFTASFAAAHVSSLEVVGTHGRLRLDPAFDHATPLRLEREHHGRQIRKTYGKRDQVAAEIAYFTRCIREDREPEPSGAEGLADIRIIRAIQDAVREGRMIPIQPIAKEERPSHIQEISVPPHGMPNLIHAEPPSR